MSDVGAKVEERVIGNWAHDQRTEPPAEEGTEASLGEGDEADPCGTIKKIERQRDVGLEDVRVDCEVKKSDIAPISEEPGAEKPVAGFGNHCRATLAPVQQALKD